MGNLARLASVTDTEVEIKNENVSNIGKCLKRLQNAFSPSSLVNPIAMALEKKSLVLIIDASPLFFLI